MTVVLRQKVVNEVQGEPFYRNNIPDAQDAVSEAYSCKGRIIANMPLLLERFPHDEWFTANSEDLVVVDEEGKYASKGEPVVITVHGGTNGWGILTPEVTRRALNEWRENGQKLGKGLNKVYAAILDPEIVQNLLYEGQLSNGKEVQIMSYKQLLDQGAPDDFRNYAVVRPLSLAKQTISGNENLNRLLDGSGNVTDSQVITYAGGREPAQGLMDRLRKPKEEGGLCWKNLGVSHLFNNKDFDSREAQGRLLYAGVDSYYALYGDNFLGNFARFAGVNLAPEAQGVREREGLEGTVEVLGEGKFLRRGGRLYMPVPEGLDFKQ